MKLIKRILPLLTLSTLCSAGTWHTGSMDNDFIEVEIRTDQIGLESTLEILGGKINYSDNGLINLTIRSANLSTFEEYGAKPVEPLENRRGQFRSYTQMLSAIDAIVTSNSNLCRVDTLGYTTQNRPVVQLIIKSDLEDERNKPIISITGATHGNEKVGSESVLTLAQDLVDQYGSNSEITSIVDQYEIKIIPVVNADGYTSHQRYIPSSYNDPNREFGWQAGYYNGPDNHSVVSYPFGDQAIKLYRNSLIEDPWFIAMDYHTGVEAVITPWFADVPLNPIDMDEYTTLGDLYVQQFPGLDKGLQYGGWMERKGMPGVQSDYPYVKAGTMALTMEVHNTQSSSEPWDLQQVCQYNTDGFIAMAKAAHKGMSGTVLGEDSEPLYARITFAEDAAHCYSSPKGGSFYKYVENGGGERVASIFANGYEKNEISLPVLSDFSPEEITLTRAPQQPYGALSIEYLRSYNRPDQSSFPKCLELKDEQGLTIESYQYESFILLDMGAGTPATDREGDDLTLYLTQNGDYSLYGSNDIDELDNNSTQNLLGRASTTESFDLSSIGADSIRYFKIVVPGGSTIGLDALEAEPREEEVGISAGTKQIKSTLTVQRENDNIRLTGFLPEKSYSIRIMDLRGRVISQSDYQSVGGDGRINTSIEKPKGAGVYIMQIITETGVLKSYSVPLF